MRLDEVVQPNRTTTDVKLIPSRTEAAELEQLSQLKAQLEVQVDDLSARLDRAEQDATKSKVEAKQYLHEAEMWQREVASLRKTLLEERDASMRRKEELEVELESLKRFLDIHDKIDESSIADQVTNINNLVEQLAAELALRLCVAQEKFIPKLDDNTRRRICTIIGRSLADALLSCDIEDDGSPSLLQYGFQAAITAWVSQIFETRSFADGGDEIIRRVAERVRYDETQPVYGRWRCIAQRSLRLIDGPTQETESVDIFVHETTRDIFYIASVFGLRVEFDELKDDLSSRLIEIAKKTINLATLAAEEVISKDYRLYIPPSGNFDPAWMVTPFPLKHAPPVDSLVTTISAGIFTISKSGRDAGEPLTRIFRRAVVITEAALDEIMNPSIDKKEARSCKPPSRKPRPG